MNDTLTPARSIASTRNLSVLAYASGFTLWVYRVDDTPMRDVYSPEFWNGTPLAAGDAVMLSSPTRVSLASVVAAADGVTLQGIV